MGADPDPDKVRTILYCYDVIPVRFPHLMSFDARQTFAKYFVDLAHVADRVVAISDATRDAYREMLVEVGAPIPEISVIHLGTDLATDMRASFVDGLSSVEVEIYRRSDIMISEATDFRWRN